jgi:hypothetical protein
VTATRWRVLLVIALVGGVLTWAGARVAASRASGIPRVPITTAALLGLLAVAVLLAALSLRGRLQGRPGRRPVPPLGAARFAVLAKAASHAGAALVGVYAGLALFYLPALDTGLRREQVVATGASAVAAALLVGAGLVLERICRVPPEDRGEDRDRSDGPSAAA